MIYFNHNKTLKNLLRLPITTPDSVVHFLAGSPGLTAILHMRQLGLFGMISRIPTNILHHIASTKLAIEPDNSTSWFVQIRKLCIKYNLPSSLVLLSNPPSII